MSQTQVRILIGLLVVVHVVLGALLTPFGLAAGSDATMQRVYMTVIGALISQPGLIAFWAALAPQSFLRRWAQALVILMCVELAGEFASAQNASEKSDPGELLQPLAWLVAFLVCQLPLRLLRARFRWQIEPPAALAPQAGEQDNQFSVRGLFLATAVVAAFVAALRWLHPNSGSTEWGFHLLRYAAMGAFMSLPAMLVHVIGWLVLMPGGRGHWRWIVGLVGLGSTAAAATAVAMLGSPGEVGELIFVPLGSLISAAGSLFVVRLCGYRLARRAADGVTAQAEESARSPSSPTTSPRWRFGLATSSLVLILAGLASLAPERSRLWRELAEKRGWSDLGLRATIVQGKIVSVTCDGGSRLLGDAVDRISACRQLARLDLSGSSADDLTLARFGKLTQLTRLSLCGTRTSDGGLLHLGKLPNLRELDLCMTDVTDDGLVALASLRMLSSVDLTHTRVTPEGIAWLRQTQPGLRIDAGADDATLSRIARRLRPNRTRLSQTAPAAPAALHVRAMGAKVTDAGVAALRGMTQIEKLDLTDAKVTDAAVGVLATLTGMTQLVLRGTQVTDSGAAKLQLKLPDCEIMRSVDDSGRE